MPSHRFRANYCLLLALAALAGAGCLPADSVSGGYGSGAPWPNPELQGKIDDGEKRAGPVMEVFQPPHLWEGR